MYNVYAYNTTYYNNVQLGVQLWSIVDADIAYGEFVLHQTENIYIREINTPDAPSSNITSFNIPNANWSVLLDRWFNARSVQMQGTIRTSDAPSLYNFIDAMKASLFVDNQFLQLTFWGTKRRARAYLSNTGAIFNNNHYNINFIQFTLEFIVTDPFRQDIVPVNNLYDDISTLAFSESIQYAGSAQSEPIISIIVNTATAITWLTIEMRDKTITITEDIQAWDLINIDMESKTVTINWQPLFYVGAIDIQRGINPYTLTFAGTSINYDYTITYKNKYL